MNERVVDQGKNVNQIEIKKEPDKLARKNNHK